MSQFFFFFNFGVCTLPHRNPARTKGSGHWMCYLPLASLCGHASLLLLACHDPVVPVISVEAVVNHLWTVNLVVKLVCMSLLGVVPSGPAAYTMRLLVLLSVALPCSSCDAPFLFSVKYVFNSKYLKEARCNEKLKNKLAGPSSVFPLSVQC